MNGCAVRAYQTSVGAETALRGVDRAARHPDPLRRQAVAVRGEDRRRRAVGADPAARLQHDHPVDQRQRLGDPVFDQDQRGVRVEAPG